MLMLTQGAAEVIAILSETPGTEGLRISRAEAPGSDDESGLQIGLVDSPGRHDEVIETDGGQVFLAPDTVETLSDKVLDADIEGRSVRFALLAQVPGGGGGANGAAI